MIELGQLEARYQAFADRGVRIVAASVDPVEDAAKTQAQFSHLTIVADPEHRLADAARVMGPHTSPDGHPVVAPTTLLLRGGRIVWVHRADTFLNRLSPDEALARLPARLGG